MTSSLVGRSTRPRREDVGDLAPLDHDELLMRCMGNFDLVQRILSMYCEQFDADYQELQACCSATQTSDLARIAHKMKGGAASVAAHELADLFSAVESAARQSDLADASDYLSQINAAHQRFRNRIDEIGETSEAE